MSLWDDVKLGAAALLDAANPANWVTGSAPLTAAAVEAENATAQARDFEAEWALKMGAAGGLDKLKQAATDTADQVKERVSKGVDWLPWVLAGAAVVALAVYVAPAVIAGKVAKS